MLLRPLIKQPIFSAITRCHSSMKLDLSVTNEIKSIFGNENFTQVESVRLHHAKDESLHQYILIK